MLKTMLYINMFMAFLNNIFTIWQTWIKHSIHPSSFLLGGGGKHPLEITIVLPLFARQGRPRLCRLTSCGVSWQLKHVWNVNDVRVESVTVESAWEDIGLNSCRFWKASTNFKLNMHDQIAEQKPVFIISWKVTSLSKARQVARGVI